MDELFGHVGMVDTFRQVEKGEGQYTWWSNRGQAWANNTGWRIDYHVATPGVAAAAREVEIYKDERFSDHAPLTIDYDYDIKQG
jgi:exodeoxyribonuclease-3